MTYQVPSEITRMRVAKWITEAQPLGANTTWTERKLAIDIGEHTYIVTNGQLFQCAHCGHYDPEWNATEVLTYFKNVCGIKPYEIDVICSVAKDE